MGRRGLRVGFYNCLILTLMKVNLTSGLRSKSFSQLRFHHVSPVSNRAPDNENQWPLSCLIITSLWCSWKSNGKWIRVNKLPCLLIFFFFLVVLDSCHAPPRHSVLFKCPLYIVDTVTMLYCKAVMHKFLYPKDFFIHAVSLRESVTAPLISAY